MKKSNAGDIADRKKKKKRRREVAAIAKICKAPKEAGAQQVVSSLNLVLNCTDSSSTITQKKPKRKRILKGLQQCGRTCELPSDEASSEKEKQSLLAWVEMCMEPWNDTSGRICNGDAFAAAHENGTCGHLPNACAFKVDHEGHICGRKSLSNGHNSLSNGHTERCSVKVRTSKHVNGASQERSVPIGQSSGVPNGEIAVASPHNNKRKREDDKVLQYVLKRSIVLHPSPSERSSNKSSTMKTVVIAWGRNIPVTLTSEACTVQEWISSQSGNLFGLDVEWRPNRAKGEKNKVALLQLCSESECLIIQMLFLDKKPQALRKLLSDPSKGLAGVGVLADGKRLLHDYGLECQGGIELTTLAVERLKRDELRNVGLKVLVQEVLGLNMDKPKKVTLSNWAKMKLDPAQINYACMDAWASFALSRKLLVDS